MSSSYAYAHKQNNNLENDTSIIEGYFPKFDAVKELSIYKLNRFLTFCLIISFILSIITYSIAIAKESTLVAIHRQANELNYENIDLQNKVNHAKSFYTINQKASKLKMLNKTNNIMVVDQIKPELYIEKDYGDLNQIVIGY